MERRTSDRRANDRRQNNVSVAVERRTEQRRKAPRRRQIDPTTCERDYSGDEIEFMHALDAYKRANGRMFPTCSEILEVIRGLGYVRVRQDASTATDETITTAQGDASQAIETLGADGGPSSENPLG